MKLKLKFKSVNETCTIGIYLPQPSLSLVSPHYHPAQLCKHPLWVELISDTMQPYSNKNWSLGPQRQDSVHKVMAIFNSLKNLLIYEKGCERYINFRQKCILVAFDIICKKPVCYYGLLIKRKLDTLSSLLLSFFAFLFFLTIFS